ncbi:MAG: DUF3429 domain-containing protein [Pseudomonadota bacterium]
MDNAVTEKFTPSLMFAGTVPFLFGALWLFTGQSVPVLNISTVLLLKSYTLAIASFMAGVHWGQSLSEPAMGPGTRLLSNVFCLIPWLLWVGQASNPLFFSASALVFASLLYFDHRLLIARLIKSDYWRLRRNVSAIVITALVVAAFLSKP